MVLKLELFYAIRYEEIGGSIYMVLGDGTRDFDIREQVASRVQREEQARRDDALTVQAASEAGLVPCESYRGVFVGRDQKLSPGEMPQAFITAVIIGEKRNGVRFLLHEINLDPKSLMDHASNARAFATLLFGTEDVTVEQLAQRLEEYGAKGARLPRRSTP